MLRLRGQPQYAVADLMAHYPAMDITLVTRALPSRCMNEIPPHAIS
ncbi:MAG: hypothetical protein H6716_17140 [Polyangiaceae bacterium]|nr:hypothetical protein [Polyangiaceae bacterium]